MLGTESLYGQQIAKTTEHQNTETKSHGKGAWVAQSVKPLTSVQVMISQFVSSSPASGSVLTAQSLEPLQMLCLPSLCAPPSCELSFKK